MPLAYLFLAVPRRSSGLGALYVNILQPPTLPARLSRPTRAARRPAMAVGWGTAAQAARRTLDEGVARGIRLRCSVAEAAPDPPDHGRHGRRSAAAHRSRCSR